MIRAFRWPVLASIVSLIAFASPLESQASAPVPQTLRGTRAEAVLLVPGPKSESSELRALAEFVRSCRVAFDISASDSATIVSRIATAPSIADAEQANIVVLYLVPVEPLEPRCARGPAAALAATRGLRASFDSSFAADRSIQSASFSFAGRSVQPVSLERARVQRLWKGGIREPGSELLRAVLRLDDLAVQPGVGMPDLRIDLELGGDGVREALMIPGEVLVDVWLAQLPRRAEGLKAEPQRYLLPQPEDPRLRRARESFAAGDVGHAIADALARVEGPGLSQAERLFAYAQSGLGFAAAGDSTAARAVLLLAGRVEPCFGLSPSAPAAYRTLVESTPRPSARCYSNSSVVTVARAALLPGFGRPSTMRLRLDQIGVAALVIGSSALSMSAFSQSASSYQDYLDWQYVPGDSPPNDALDRIYRDASSAQDRGVSLRMFAVSVYTAQFVWSVVAERRLASRLRAVESLGGMRGSQGVSVIPIFAPGRAGLAMTVTW